MTLRTIGRIVRRVGALSALLTLVAAAPGHAAGPAISMHVSGPDAVNEGVLTRILVVVQNTGDAPLSGDLTLADTFPTGLGIADASVSTTSGAPATTCTTVAQTDSCSAPVDGILPGGQVYFTIFSPVAPDAAGTLVNTLEVTGGGAPQDLTAQESMVVGPAAPFAFKTFATALDDTNGLPVTQAGADPSAITATLEFPTVASDVLTVFPTTAAVEQFKTVLTHLPVGLVGNAVSTPVRCTGAQLANSADESADREIPACPLESQVGIVRIADSDLVPIYNMVPPIGSPAAFGFQYQSVPVVLLAKVRPDDNGIDIVARDASSSVPIPGVEVTFWGVPADSSHDNVRGLCLDGLIGNNGSVCPSHAPRTAFLRLPTSCTGNPLPWSADATSFVHPDTQVHAQTTSPALGGCDLAPFDPALTLTPTNQVPHAPTGLDARLTLPQGATPDGIAEADLRAVSTQLPDGMTINPSSATGLQACSDAQLRLGVDGVASCPDASKIGTVSVTTPLLDHPLAGSIFLRTQNSDDPDSGQLFRIAIEIRSDDDGIDIKQPASIAANPNSGRLTATFDQIPQLPISSLELHFKSGPRAPLATPSTCDAASNLSNIAMTSWSNKTVASQDSFGLSGDGKGGPCAASTFAPAFSAGTQNPVAGKSTPFLFSLSREDGDQALGSVTVETPKGLLGRIKNAELCSDAAASAGICGAASQVGTATVGAGVGPNPFFITNGRVYLTGPYKGAPYGLSVVVRALAGPFDLGTVVVRTAIFVDKHTAALRVVSDPFPTILKGVPLNLRDVRLSIDKPNFIINPTNCTAAHVDGTATSTQGATAALVSRFQVGECKNLKFAPKISLSVGATHRTKNGTSTPFSTTLTQTAGQSNLRTVSVTLPGTLNALLPVVNRACKLTEFNAGHCTSRAKVGSAVAVTPLLKDPLKGSVYFVKNPARVIPDLMVALRGQVNLDLTGKVRIPGGKRLATSFDTIPDAPITKFTLKLVSGKNGPVGVVSNLCTAKAKAAAAAISILGQNGARVTSTPRLHIHGCAKAKRKKN